jgi:hypothetical protein
MPSVCIYERILFPLAKIQLLRVLMLEYNLSLTSETLRRWQRPGREYPIPHQSLASHAGKVSARTFQSLRAILIPPRKLITVSDAAHVGNQSAFRGPEICGVDAEEDACETDFTPRASSNCLRHLEIKPSKRSSMANCLIRPSIVAGLPISINS